MGGGTLQTFGSAEHILGQMLGPRQNPTLITTNAQAVPADRQVADAQRNAG